MTMEIWEHWVIDHLIRTSASDCYLAAGDDEDDENQEQEPEHVVELVLVDGGEDEEQLDEAGSEGEDPRHHGAHCRMHVPNLCILWLE